MPTANSIGAMMSVAPKPTLWYTYGCHISFTKGLTWLVKRYSTNTDVPLLHSCTSPPFWSTCSCFDHMTALSKWASPKVVMWLKQEHVLQNGGDVLLCTGRSSLNVTKSLSKVFSWYISFVHQAGKVMYPSSPLGCQGTSLSLLGVQNCMYHSKTLDNW